MRTKKLLTAAAVFCRSLAWFPLGILLLSVHSAEGQLRNLTLFQEMVTVTLNAEDQVLIPSALVCGISFVLQMTACRIRAWFPIDPRKVFAVRIAAAIFAAVLSVFAVSALSGSVFSAVVLTFAALFITLFGLDNPPEKLFTTSHYAAFLTAVMLCALTLHISGLPMHTNAFLAVTGIISAVHLLLCNQFMLLRLVNRRSNAETPVPQDIRRSNLVMVIAVLVFLAVVFLFRRPLTDLMIWMRDTAATTFWKLVMKLIQNKEPLENIAEKDDILPPPDIKTDASPLWILLWLPVLFAVWIIWRNLLSDWVYVIRDLLSRLLAFLRGKSGLRIGKKRLADTGEYYDTETTERRPLNKKQMKRRWRQQVRAWKTQPDSREKFYAGYQLLLTAPAWETGELRDADTVREIREKWLTHHTPQDALDAVTAAYHTDRYAERGLPEKAVAELSAALDKLR